MTSLCFIHPIFTVVVNRLISQNCNKAPIYCVCMHSTWSNIGRWPWYFLRWVTEAWCLNHSTKKNKTKTKKIQTPKTHLFFLHGKSQKDEACFIFNFSVGEMSKWNNLRQQLLNANGSHTSIKKAQGYKARPTHLCCLLPQSQKKCRRCM